MARFAFLISICNKGRKKLQKGLGARPNVVVINRQWSDGQEILHKMWKKVL